MREKVKIVGGPSRDVLRAQLDLARHNLAEMRGMYDTLLAKYEALAHGRLAQPIQPVEAMEPIEYPPDEVMAAMKAISPVRDKTYEANWAYWEANKEKARLHPAAFAAEIAEGITYEPPPSILLVPEGPLPVS